MSERWSVSFGETKHRVLSVSVMADGLPCLCNPYVVSLLEAVRRHHSFGFWINSLIYVIIVMIFLCLYNVYIVRTLLTTKVSYQLSIYKIKQMR